MPKLNELDTPTDESADSQIKYFFANKPLELSGEGEAEKLSDIRFAQEKGFPLPDNPSIAVDTTLRSLGLTTYPSEIPDALTYASIRIRSSHDHFPGYNYGTFVTSEDGNFAFAKLRYGPKNMERVLVDGDLITKRVGGLAREKDVLTSLESHGYEVPKVFGYTPALPEGRDLEPNESDTLETLFIEAISPEVGSTIPPEYWTKNTARIAAEKIKTFDKPADQIELFAHEGRSISVEALLKRSKLADDTYSRELLQTIEAYQHLDKPIVVHGDTWLNNIIVKHDNSDVMFVDWELAGPGYKGQDAGRTVWGLTLDQNWGFAGVNDAAQEFIDTWCISDEETKNLRFGLVLESLRWIADRQDSLDQASDEESVNTLREIQEIKQHTMKVMHVLDKHAE